MPMRKALLLFHSLRHTQPSQLLHRVRLLAKRKLMVAVATSARQMKAAQARGTLPPLHPQLPRPLFQPRAHLVVRDAQLAVRFLNESRSIALPLDWRPRELRTGTRLWLLNLHYMEFLEGLQDDEFLAYVASWRASNLPYEPGYWLDNWNSYSLSIRVVVWMQQIASRRFEHTEPRVEGLLRSLLAQLRFVESKIERDIGGNHLIKNIKALLWGARFFTGADAERWLRLGEGLLRRELAEQILPDGMHYELSPAYHAQVFADLMECFSVLTAGPVRDELGLRLSAMAQNLADMTHPDGLCSLFNDGGLNMAYSNTECLAVYKQLFGREARPAAQISYPDAGYFGLRNEDELLLIDCGEVGAGHLPAHGHGDALSLEWSVRGRRALIDTGVFHYNPGPLRAQSRSTRAHNTVTLDDVDQSEFWKAFRVGRRAHIIERSVEISQAALVVEGAHDGYARLAGKPIHRRRFSASPGRIRLEDHVTAGAGQVAVARLLVHPDFEVVIAPDGSATCSSPQVQFKVKASVGIGVAQTTCFMNFGHSVPTSQLIIEYGPAPVSGWVEIGHSN